uniref:RBR-type E3 ubiquitin transferase n=1 Tax=Eptatretus burgeri TaxID=7764 RepID=A0A8C4NFT5_EPTBU
MNNQTEDMSDDGDVDDDCSDYDGQVDIQHYYQDADRDVEEADKEFDPEEYHFVCLSRREAERLLHKHEMEAAALLEVQPDVAKLVLCHFHWRLSEIADRCKYGRNKILIDAFVKNGTTGRSSGTQCAVCLQSTRLDRLFSLACQHAFCRPCWEQHCQLLVRDGCGVDVTCMAQDCFVRAPETFVLPLLGEDELREKYQKFLLRDYIESHFQLQMCPGIDCPSVVEVVEPKARRVVCSRCDQAFCFRCRQMYHAPTDCHTIRKWLTKCADDSETANYISAHTKDCPKCHICIEKNGGCNHMQCCKCKHAMLEKRKTFGPLHLRNCSMEKLKLGTCEVLLIGNKCDFFFTSANEGEEGYVFTPFCVFFCLFVCRISQKVADGSGCNFVDRLSV